MLNTNAVGCADGMEFRVLVAPGWGIQVFVGGINYAPITDNTITVINTGAAGIGVRGAPATNGFKQVNLGLVETVAPGTVPRASVAVTAFANNVDMRWAPVADDAEGRGFWRFNIYRDHQYYATTFTPNYSDATAQPGTTYLYEIQAQDWDCNYAITPVTVVTPAAGNVDQRQPGVRALGSYWGASGENIDMQSGNLNFSIPLMKAGGRGISLSMGLSYNSQLWRKDAAGSWMLGRDTGFGFGWRFGAGALIPYYTSYYDFDHYTFLDSTGAEYRLQRAGNGLWTTSDGLYLTFDSNTNRLWFNDGSFWYFGCQSGGTEADAGVRYPTLVEDSNGNQITIAYAAGSMASQSTNTSSRVTDITDVRGYYRLIYYQGHLSGNLNYIGTAEKYSFSVNSNVSLQAPFAGATESFGTTTLLTSVTDVNGLTHAFEYNASGELTGVTLPYGGRLGYDYQDFTFANGHTIREVLHRKLRTTPVSADSTWTLWSDPDDPSRLSHRYHSVSDPTTTYDRVYFFGLDPSAPSYRLETDYVERRITDWKIYLWRTSGWALSSSNQPYLSETTTGLDPNTPDQKTSKTQQAVDGYGNLLWQKIYDYDSLTTPARTYQNTYLTDSNYTSRYVRNRSLSSTLTSASGTRTLVSRRYDTSPEVGSFYLQPANGATLHDSNIFTDSYVWRGNPVVENRLGKPARYMRYDVTGNPFHTFNSAGQTVTANWDSSKNYAVPSTLTPNSNTTLSQSMTYNSFLGVTQVNSPNGVSQSYGWDSSARPASSQSPHGAVATYTYTNSPPTTTATVNGRWTKTTMDGLGRAVKVETGSGTTTLSVTETEYGLCACTPLGKVYRVSRPHAPGVAPVWTTYTYDARGRTLQVSQPNDLGATTYAYAGNVVTVTDPAGRWKKYTTDAMGNLVHVTEPNPQTAGQTYETSYVYNDLDQLTRVEMPRPYQSGTVTQVRTWTYNALGQLASETQPESGTMSYTYDSVGRLASKTDSRSIREEYSYDLYNRLLQKRTYSGTVEQTQFPVDYVYDTATNGNGRLNAVKYYFPWVSSTTYATYSESFEYTAGGSITAKSLTWYDGTGAHSMAGTYTYDNEGRITTEKYPDYWKARSSGTAYDLYTGRTMKYSYDGYGRLSEVNAGSLYPIGWNAAGQLTSLGALSYQYDSIGRLTREQAYGSMDFEYRYLAGINDGKIWQRKDNISGEEITYQYDSLGRLSSAQTTSAEWGFSWVYDGFGNRLQQNLTKGTGPSVNLSIDPANNRLLSGPTYDAAGNMTTVIAGGTVNTYSYDINHRTTSFGQNTEVFRSATGEKLVQRIVSSPTVLYFHNPAGQLLGAYAIKGTNSIPVLDEATDRIYVLGKLVWSGGKTVTQDRLGSIVHDGPDQLRYYPYGEEIGGATAQNRPKFATYNRMDSGIDDAVNRFYNPTWGRFTSPDPYPGVRSLAVPASWNRYAYVEGDPTNSVDPSGQMMDMLVPGFCSAEFGFCGSDGGGYDFSGGGGGGYSSGPNFWPWMYWPWGPPVGGGGYDFSQPSPPKLDCKVDLLGQPAGPSFDPFDHTVLKVDSPTIGIHFLEGIPQPKDKAHQDLTSDPMWLNASDSSPKPFYPNKTTLITSWLEPDEVCDRLVAMVHGFTNNAITYNNSWPWDGPNSNSFTHSLLNANGLSVAGGGLSNFWYPGWSNTSVPFN